MRAWFLALSLCALQPGPAAVLGGPQRQRFVLGSHGWPARLSKVYKFSWQNCASSPPAWVKSLSVIPDPVVIPGDVTLMACGTTTTALESPLKMKVNLEKRAGDMWITVPCVDQLGSCTYDDFCAILDSAIPPGQACPEPLLSYGLPCHCPFKAGTYRLPPSDIYIPKLDVPVFLLNGDYRLKATMSDGEQELGCVKLSFSVHAQSRWFWW